MPAVQRGQPYKLKSGKGWGLRYYDETGFPPPQVAVLVEVLGARALPERDRAEAARRARAARRADVR
jgi:hypothetical protein